MRFQTDFSLSLVAVFLLLFSSCNEGGLHSYGGPKGQGAQPHKQHKASVSETTGEGIEAIQVGLRLIEKMGPPEVAPAEGPALPFRISTPTLRVAGAHSPPSLSFVLTPTGIKVHRFSPLAKLHCTVKGRILVQSQPFELSRTPKEERLAFPGIPLTERPERCQLTLDYTNPVTEVGARDPLHFCFDRAGVKVGVCAFARPSGLDPRLTVEPWQEHKGRTGKHALSPLLLTRGEGLTKQSVVHLYLKPVQGPPEQHLLSHLLVKVAPYESLLYHPPVPAKGVPKELYITQWDPLSKSTVELARFCTGPKGRLAKGACVPHGLKGTTR